MCFTLLCLLELLNWLSESERTRVEETRRGGGDEEGWRRRGGVEAGETKGK